MIKSPLKKVWQCVYRMYALRQNVYAGGGLHIGVGSILWAPHKLHIGRNVYIGKFCTVECDGDIGDDVMIANNVGLIGRYDHDFTCVGKTIRRAPWIGDGKECASNRIIIGSDVWIGYGAIILTGVTVGRGAIVAAGSVVTHDVAPYSIVAGAPARKIGERFSREQIVEHERILNTRHLGKCLNQASDPSCIDTAPDIENVSVPMAE